MPFPRDTDVAIAAVTLAELRHGVLAADSARRPARELFVRVTIPLSRYCPTHAQPPLSTRSSSIMCGVLAPPEGRMTSSSPRTLARLDTKLSLAMCVHASVSFRAL